MEDVTSIKCENITEEIIQKYQEEGFKLAFQEYVMEHKLTVIPQMDTFLSLKLRNWSTSLEADFYEVYNASFRDRPGFPGWSREKWIDWISSSSTFLPERTYIATVDNKGVGFIATDNDEEFPSTHGYIIQVGTIPEWRRKGIAAILINTCLEALYKDGKKVVILHVNQNNSGAISLYEQLGFKTVRIRGTFEKLS